MISLLGVLELGLLASSSYRGQVKDSADGLVNLLEISVYTHVHLCMYAHELWYCYRTEVIKCLIFFVVVGLKSCKRKVTLTYLIKQSLMKLDWKLHSFLWKWSLLSVKRSNVLIFLLQWRGLSYKFKVYLLTTQGDWWNTMTVFQWKFSLVNNRGKHLQSRVFHIFLWYFES